MPVDVTPSNTIATCGIGSAKVLRVLDFLAGIVGVNGVMRFLVLEEPVSPDGKQLFSPPATPTTLMRQLGAKIRMRESGDVLELEDDRGKIHTGKWVRKRSGHVHNRLDSFSKGGWNLPHDLCVQLKHDPFTVDNLRKAEYYGRYEFKRGHQTNLVPTSECFGLEVLETVNTVDGKCNQDDVQPEDLWPNFNAMVTKHHEKYFGLLGEKFIAQQH